jgi:hypothetical protein
MTTVRAKTEPRDEEQALDRRAVATQETILLEIAMEHLDAGSRVLLLPSGILLDARKPK